MLINELVLEIEFSIKIANFRKLSRAIECCNINKDVEVTLNKDFTISIHSDCAEESFVELLRLYEYLIN